MNQQEVMQKVRELALAIANSKHPDNTLDIASLKAKCVELYEHIQILIAVPQGTEEPEMTSREVQEIKPLIEAQINDPAPFVQPVMIPVTQETIHEEPVEEKLPEPVADVPEVPKPVETHREQPTLQEIFARTEKQKDEQLLHAKIAQSSGKNDLSEKFQGKVESLKASISLNKKIAFVNMLFGENTVEYAKAIDKLNNASTLDEALRYFSELKHQYNWEAEHELVKDLQGMIEKRFGG